MDTQTDKKVKFILAWYNKEKVKLSEEQRLLLLKRWVKTCSAAEEYEMAKALANEKVKQIRKMRKAKRKRSFFENMKLKMSVLIRKITR